MNKTYKLTVTAILIALSTALSFIRIIRLPLGGSVTLLSMLPLAMISILYGTAYTIMPCLLYAIVQMLTDGVFAWGLSASVLAGSITFDYLVAFTALSLAGIFRKAGTKGIYCGICLAMLLRFFSHFLSGCIFFKNFDYFGGSPVLYSLCYNGGFMLPEMIMTVIAAFLMFRMDSLKNRIMSQPSNE